MDIKTSIYTVGSLIRGHFRRACMSLGITYQEDKGFFDSGFVLEGDVEKIKRLNRWLIEELDFELEVGVEHENT